MKRILACLFILAVFPLMTSSSRHGINISTPFAPVAFAGHTTQAGYFCNCDPTPDGVCPCCGMNFNNRLTADEFDDNALIKPACSTDAQPGPDSEPGSATMLLLIALMFWSRISA